MNTHCATLGIEQIVLLQVVNIAYSPAATAICMKCLAELRAQYVGNCRFSIGIDRVSSPLRLKEITQWKTQQCYSGMEHDTADGEEGQIGKGAWLQCGGELQGVKVLRHPCN